MKVIGLPFRIRETGEGSGKEGRPQRTEEHEDIEERVREFLEKLEAEEEAESDIETPAGEEREHPSSTVSEFEEDMLEVYEEFGIDGEKVRELWNEDRIKDVEEAVGTPEDREQVESENEKRDLNRTTSESTETVGDHTVVDVGGGLVCVVETGGHEESSLENVEPLEKEQTGSCEESEVEEAVEQDAEHPETEEQPADMPTKSESVRFDSSEITAAASDESEETSESRKPEEAERRSRTSSEAVTEDPEKSEDVSTGESKETRPGTRSAERQAVQEREEGVHPGVVESRSDDPPEVPEPEHEQLMDERRSELSESEGPSEGLLSSTEIEAGEGDHPDSQAEAIEGSPRQDSIEAGRELEHEEPRSDTREDSPSETEMRRQETESEEQTTGAEEDWTEDQESAVLSGPEVQRLESRESEESEERNEEPSKSERIIASIFPEDGPVLRPMLPDEMHLGLFPETEEEQVRRRLKELFDSLTDEQKEEVRKLIRVEVESVEELDELVARFPDCQYNPDFKAMYQEAVESIQALHEARSEGGRALPRLIQALRNREAERRWAEIVLLGTRDEECSTKREVTLESIHGGQEVIRKKPRYRPHTGKPRSVKLCQPVIMGKNVKSRELLEKLIEKHHPGLRERKDFIALMKDACKFFELVDALKGRTVIRQWEVDEIADRLSMSMDTARSRVFYGQMPLVFRILEERLSIGEAKALIRKFKVKLRGITCWVDVQRRLDKMYPGREYEQIPDFAKRKEAALGFFRLMGMLKGGGSTKELARRANIRVRVARSWTSGTMRGEIPWLVRHVLPMSSSSGNRRMRHLHKVKMRFPVIRGKEIRSIEQLRELIERDFPTFKERKDYQELLHTAEQYFIVKEESSGRAFFRADELPVLEKRTRRSTETVSQWLIGKAFPMVFDMLGNALSVREAKIVSRRLVRKLKGVISFETMLQRLSTLYILKDLSTLPAYKDTRFAKGFYAMLEALAEGGLNTDLARKSGLDVKELRTRLLEYSLPRLVRIASQIPPGEPREGFKWLPMRILHSDVLKSFIQVPAEIRSPEDVYAVLKQLKPVTNPQMAKWRKRFGYIDRRTAFLYALGSLVSDGSFTRRTGTSSAVTMSLSAGYAWSERFGEAFSYCLGRNGIVCRFLGERKRGVTRPQLLWRSTSSPLFAWVMRTLLGLDRIAKTNSRIRAEWVLALPRKLRVPFVQGWADGDGYASVRTFTPGISSKMNKDLLKRLLDSLGVASNIVTNGVAISRTESVIRASRLPLFRMAVDRQGRLEAISQMINSMKWTPVSKDELKIILQLHRQGHTFGEITVLLWAEYGIARRPTTIRNIIRRHARSDK